MPSFPRFVKSGPALATDVKLNVGSLADYIGIPVRQFYSGDPLSEVSFQISDEFGSFSQLPFRAYQLIYNQYYIDENLQTPVNIVNDSNGILDVNTPNGLGLLTLRKRAWEKDYFTSALPWLQRGTPMTLPIAGEAPVS